MAAHRRISTFGEFFFENFFEWVLMLLDRFNSGHMTSHTHKILAAGVEKFLEEQ